MGSFLARFAPLDANYKTAYRWGLVTGVAASLLVTPKIKQVVLLQGLALMWAFVTFASNFTDYGVGPYALQRLVFIQGFEIASMIGLSVRLVASYGFASPFFDQLCAANLSRLLLYLSGSFDFLRRLIL